MKDKKTLREKLFNGLFLGVSFINFLKGKPVTLKAVGLDILQAVFYFLIIFFEYLEIRHLIETAHRLPPVVAHCIGL